MSRRVFNRGTRMTAALLNRLGPVDVNGGGVKQRGSSIILPSRNEQPFTKQDYNIAVQNNGTGHNFPAWSAAVLTGATSNDTLENMVRPTFDIGRATSSSQNQFPAILQQNLDDYQSGIAKISGPTLAKLYRPDASSYSRASLTGGQFYLTLDNVGPFRVLMEENASTGEKLGLVVYDPPDTKGGEFDRYAIQKSAISSNPLLFYIDESPSAPTGHDDPSVTPRGWEVAVAVDMVWDDPPNYALYSAHGQVILRKKLVSGGGAQYWLYLSGASKWVQVYDGWTLPGAPTGNTGANSGQTNTSTVTCSVAVSGTAYNFYFAAQYILSSREFRVWLNITGGGSSSSCDGVAWGDVKVT